MNKSRVILIIILLLTITLINIIQLKKAKKSFNETLSYEISFEKKAKNILALKEVLKNKISYLEKICKQNYNTFICKNLDKNNFTKFNYSLRQINIKKLKIQKNKNNKVDIVVEIE